MKVIMAGRARRGPVGPVGTYCAYLGAYLGIYLQFQASFTSNRPNAHRRLVKSVLVPHRLILI